MAGDLTRAVDRIPEAVGESCEHAQIDELAGMPAKRPIPAERRPVTRDLSGVVDIAGGALVAVRRQITKPAPRHEEETVL